MGDFASPVRASGSFDVPGNTPSQVQMTLTVEKERVTLMLGGATYQATLQSLSDPNLSFTFAYRGSRTTFYGLRNGRTLTGTCAPRNGNWALTLSGRRIGTGLRW